MPKTRLAALALVAALAVPMAAACSKSSETSTGSNNNNASSTTTTAKSGSGGGSGTPSTGDCIKAAQQYTALLGSATSALVPGQSVDQSKLQSQLDEVKGSVPSDLQADMETWANAFSEYINNLKDIDLSNPANLVNPDTAKKFQEASAPLEKPEVKKAQANISAYFDKCSTSTPSLSIPS